MSRWVLIGLVGSLAAAGCGGEGGEGGSRASRDARPAATPADAATEAAESATEEPSSGAPMEAEVEMKGFEFVPARTEVAAGGRITWRNRDKSNHTATFESPRVRGIPNLRVGGSRSVGFRKAGTYEYRCEFHPTMTGVVVVG